MHADGLSPDPVFAPELHDETGMAAARLLPMFGARLSRPATDPQARARAHAGELIQEAIWLI